MSSSGVRENYHSARNPSQRARDRRAWPSLKDPTRTDKWYQITNRANRRNIWAAWNNNRVSDGLPRVDPPVSARINVTNRPLRGETSDSISYNNWRSNHFQRESVSGPLLDAFNTQRNRQNEAAEAGLDHRRFNDPELNDLVESGALNDIGESSLPGTTEPTPGPSGQQSKRPRLEESSTTAQPPDSSDENMSDHSAERMDTGGGGSPDGVAQRGGIGASSGGFDNAQGPESYIGSGGYSHGSGYMTFKKSHHLKAWAVPFASVSVAGLGLGQGSVITTPMAKIPWEYPYFYMSQEEFNLIPAGSRIKSAHIKVKHITNTTGFETGGTATTIATTNHPKVMLIGYDLEKNLRSSTNLYCTYDSNGFTQSVALPTTAQATLGNRSPIDDFILRQYGQDQSETSRQLNGDYISGCSTGIPYYTQVNFCMFEPNPSDAATNPNPLGFTAANAPGQENFLANVTQVNANDVTWESVAEMHHNFNSAPIGAQFRPLEIDQQTVTNLIPGGESYNMQRAVTNNTVGSNFTKTETILPSSYDSIPLVRYKGYMEQGECMVTGHSGHSPARQKSLHIGMKALDKASPSANLSRQSNFVQSVVYFVVEATLKIETNNYPNRFMKPKFFNVSYEHARLGTGRYPAVTAQRALVTYGLNQVTNTQPTAADEVDNHETAGVKRKLPKGPATNLRSKKRK